MVHLIVSNEHGICYARFYCKRHSAGLQFMTALELPSILMLIDYIVRYG